MFNLLTSFLFETFQSTEVANSNNMELEGLKRSLAFLKDEGLVVKSLVTDRHQQIAKYLRENHPEIDHYFDVWHIAKSEWYDYIIFQTKVIDKIS